MIAKFIRWILDQIGVRNVIYVSLLSLAMGSTAYGLSQVIRGLDFEQAGQIAFCGVVLAWVCAGSRMPDWSGAVALLISGAMLLLVVSGHLLGPFVSLFLISNRMIWGYLHQDIGVPLDVEPFNQAYSDVYYGIRGVIAAIGDWIISLKEGLPVYDDIAIILVWGFSIWIVACWAGWFLRRYKQPVTSMVPAGVLLAVVFSYSWAKTGPILSLMFAVLSLIAVVNYDQHEERWLKTGMDYPEEMPKEIGVIVGTLIVGLVALAAILPIFSVGNLVEYVRQFTKPQIEEAEPVIRSFGLNQGVIAHSEMGNAMRAGFPRQHLLEGGPQLAETLVMTVKISGGFHEESSNLLTLPLYWRSLTYDEYTGSGWQSSDIVLRSYKAGERIIATGSDNYNMIQIDVRLAPGQTRYLYAVGEIVTSNGDFEIAYRPTVHYTEVLAAHGDFMGASTEKSSYQVQSFVPVVTEDDLRNVVEEYPQWVVDRYLFLPASLPARVGLLAVELTQGETTSYDKAKRLEKYLQGFEYTLDVTLPDSPRDMVDYFLFDLRKGYCDYYASSMVVMARSIGIPARLAIGYSLGSYDEVNHRYIVTEDDAHSWVEVYFPDIGWIPFEPTASRASIERLIPGDNETNAFTPLEPTPPSTFWRAFFPRYGWATVLYILGGCASLIVLVLVLDSIRLRRLPPSRCMRILYQRLYRYGRVLSLPGYRSETPWEFATRLQNRINQVSQSGVFKEYLVSALQDITEFTLVYTRMLYSPENFDFSRQVAILVVWQRLRPRLWIAVMLQAFHPRRFPIPAGETTGDD